MRRGGRSQVSRPRLVRAFAAPAVTGSLAATLPPVVRSESGTVTAPDGHTYFQDGFESGNLSSPTIADSGWSWGDSNWDGTALTPTTANPKTGLYSQPFAFKAGADIDDAWEEQRFHAGSSLTSLYVRYWLYIPSNYAHRNTSSSDNNKFFRIWATDYGQVKLGCSTVWRSSTDATQGSSLIMEQQWNGGSMGQYSLPTYTDFITPSDFGAWMRIQMYYQMDTGSSNARMKVWKNGTQIIDTGNFANPASGWPTAFTDGYILGYANSGFAVQTTLYVDDVVFSDSPE